MVSRRGFLGGSALLGAASMGLCTPPVIAARSPAGAVVSDLDQKAFLQARAGHLEAHDPTVFLGYPSNRRLLPEAYLQWCEELSRQEFGRRQMNNVGDPFYGERLNNSHMLERDLIQRFGVRYGFSADNLWGFVSNSGTDSNLHGAFIGRTLLHTRTGVMPRLYYTAEAHYSIQIVGHLLAMESVVVDTLPDGSMDVQHLEQLLDKNVPAVILATIGTTLKGAIDDIDGINRVCAGHQTYIHLDAALFGGYLQASEHASDLYQRDDKGRARYQSLAVSCHKFFGYPASAGLFIAQEDLFEAFRDEFAAVHDPAYISHVPGTITCSRDAIKPAQFHYFSTAPALIQQQADAKLVLKNAAYLADQMQRHFPELDAVQADRRSNTVYFRNSVDPKVVRKWTLAKVKPGPGRPYPMAHVVVMPHAEKTLLDRFLEDLNTGRA